MDSKDTYRSVQDRYAGIASQTEVSRKQGDYERKVAKAFGYDLEDLQSIPELANLGVSCGNPLAMANIREVGDVTGLLFGAELNTNLQGEVVIDLGSGGGIDVLLAAKKVGAEGKAIGIDMTKVYQSHLLSRVDWLLKTAGYATTSTSERKESGSLQRNFCRSFHYLYTATIFQC